MSDQTNDQTLAGTESETVLPAAFGGNPESAIDNILSLERVLNSARLVERTVRICLRADLEAELAETLGELATLVDKDGNVLGAEEAALGDPKTARAEALKNRASRIREEMALEEFTVRFRALPDDQWNAFEKTHRKPDGTPKDIREYNNELIAATAVAPTMTPADVQAIRGKLSASQMTSLANAAFTACTVGGLDVPKLPTFSLVQRPAQQ